MRDAQHTAQVLGACAPWAYGWRSTTSGRATRHSATWCACRSRREDRRSFVRDCSSCGARSRGAAVTALGHRLGLTVVAEGVETQGERDALREEGCDIMQGFFTASPCPRRHAAGARRRHDQALGAGLPEPRRDHTAKRADEDAAWHGANRRSRQAPWRSLRSGRVVRVLRSREATQAP